MSLRVEKDERVAMRRCYNCGRSLAGDAVGQQLYFGDHWGELCPECSKPLKYTINPRTETVTFTMHDPKEIIDQKINKKTKDIFLA